MGKLTLKQCSRPAGGACAVECNREANLVLHCDYATLFRVTTADGKFHFVWGDDASMQSEMPEYCPVFAEDDTEGICEIKEIKPLLPEEIFCFNNDSYFVSENNRKTQMINQLEIYAAQSVVEQIVFYDEDPEPVEEIYLAKIFTVDRCKKYVMTSWVVKRASSLEHVPIFEEEAELFDKAQELPNFHEKIGIGDIFKARGKYYEVLRDTDGKLCIGLWRQHLWLRQHLGQRMLPSEDDDEDEKSGQKQQPCARIIKMPLH